MHNNALSLPLENPNAPSEHLICEKGFSVITALMHIRAGLETHCSQRRRVACACFGFFSVSYIARITSPQTALSSELGSKRM